MKDGYINIDGYCLGKKCKNMFAFNDMIPDMLCNKIRTSTVFMKIPNKRKVQQNATNESLDIGFKDFKITNKMCTMGHKYIIFFLE